MSTVRFLPWIAIGLAVLAIVLAALMATPAPSVPPAPRNVAPAGAAAAPDAALARCQALGEAGARDPQCLAAWAANRRRFLGLGPAHSKE
jgi:conjugative transfer region protein TrbK